MKRDPPKCRGCGKVLEWLPWKNGKPQRPVDPSTKKPCECWKTGNRNTDDSDPYSRPRFLKAKDYTKCPYCDGYYETDIGNVDHELTYHKDKKVHRGMHVTGDGCWEDEILYYGSEERWFLCYPNENGEFLSVNGKENVREFANKHGIKVIRSEYLLD